MLNLCSKDHEEICFEGNDCPLCEANDSVSELEADVEDKQQEIENFVTN